MAIHKLTARKVATAAQGKYEDGAGLRLVVSAKGAKKWVLRFTIQGKRREMGLGSYPNVMLEQARKLASDARNLIQEKIDPITLRKVALAEIITIPSFKECALDYIEMNKVGWKNEKHYRQWITTLENYAFPFIGDKPINEITIDNIILILNPIWLEKNETAKRVQTRIAKIIDYAKARNLRTDENPARWQGHLDTILPKPSVVQKTKHHPAMPYSSLPDFWKELQINTSTSSKALQFLILTATRTSEVLQARWDEINFEAALWVIPAERMKAGKEHKVPLSHQALQILKNIPKEQYNPYLFIGGKPRTHLSNMALLKLMRTMGYSITADNGNYVPHGFRSTFRDWAGEVSNYPRDVAEMALAHTIKNKVEAAYRRGDLLNKRTEMMQEWANFFSK